MARTQISGQTQNNSIYSCHSWILAPSEWVRDSIPLRWQVRDGQPGFKLHVSHFLAVDKLCHPSDFSARLWNQERPTDH